MENMQTPKYKILHLLAGNTSFSGAENVVSDIITILRDDFEMIYCSPDSKGYITSNLEKRGITYRRLKNFSVREVDRAIRDEKPDIIHAHDFKAAIMASRYKNITVIAHLHNNPPWQLSVNMKSIVFATCIHRLSKVYGVSQSVYNEYIFKKLYKNKFEVLPNVVNKDKVSQMAKEPNESLRCDLLFVGRLVSQKNPVKALEIVKEVNRKKSVKAIFLGDGELRGECEQYIADNSLENVVALIGNVDNPYMYMENARLLLMPSEFEGFGLVAVEAMILGVPVVCSGVGGLPEIVDSSCGAVCHDIEEYVEQIIRMLQDNDCWERFSNNAVLKSGKYTDVQQYKLRLKEEYLNLIEETRCEKL